MPNCKRKKSDYKQALHHLEDFRFFRTPSSSSPSKAGPSPSSSSSEGGGGDLAFSVLIFLRVEVLTGVTLAPGFGLELELVCFGSGSFVTGAASASSSSGKQKFCLRYEFSSLPNLAWNFSKVRRGPKPRNRFLASKTKYLRYPSSRWIESDLTLIFLRR